MTEPIDTREIEIRRTYDLPREVLFAMWTEAEHLTRWWGPDGFAAPHVESDPRPGGALVIHMVGQGMDQTMEARYREVVAPELLTVDSVVPGPGGQPVLESSHTVTFAERDGGTEVTVRARASVFAEAARMALEGMKAGWRQSLQCLDDVVRDTTDRQLVLQRMLNVPPVDAFGYWVDQRHLEQWWGPDGTEYPSTVRFDELVPGERVVLTHGEPQDPDPAFTMVVTFDEMAGKTVLSMRLVFATTSDRDVVEEKYHAVEGANQTLGRLAALAEGR